MAQIVNRLPQTLMGELYMSVRSPVDPPLCSPPGAGRVKQVSITAPCLPARNIATWAAAPAQSNGQQLGSAASPSADRPSSSVVHNSAAARYASARHVVVQHKQAKQVTQRGTTEQPAVEPERPLQQLKEQKQKHSSSSCRSRQQHQQKKQLATVDVAHGRQRRPLETQGEQHPSKIQQHVQQQLLQHRQLRQQQDSPFANALSLYKMYACSHSMVEWQEGEQTDRLQWNVLSTGAACVGCSAISRQLAPVSTGCGWCQAVIFFDHLAACITCAHWATRLA